ncbi:MAG: hypothetical protein KKD17_03415 [Nanoarchaeota archaeon]|nr:hypothetical protein [Nanoarchaeota archaeon]
MKSKSKGLSLRTTTALILIIFLLGMGGTAWYYALYKVAYIQVFDIEIKIVPGSKAIGFNADPTLHFGKLPEVGGKAEKELNLFNDWDIPLLLMIRVKGDAAPFISVENNTFIMQPKEFRKIKVYAVVPEGFNKTGIYTGEAKVMFLRP